MSETRTTNPLICSQALSAETNRTCVAVAHHLLLLLLIIIIIPSKQQPSSKLSPTQQQQQTTLPPPPFYKNFNKKKTHETTSTPFLLSLLRTLFLFYFCFNLVYRLLQDTKPVSLSLSFSLSLRL
jgi:hypothetical protein